MSKLFRVWDERNIDNSFVFDSESPLRAAYTFAEAFTTVPDHPGTQLYIRDGLCVCVQETDTLVITRFNFLFQNELRVHLIS